MINTNDMYAPTNHHSPRTRFNPLDPDMFVLHCSHHACEFFTDIHTDDDAARAEFDAHC